MLKDKFGIIFGDADKRLISGRAAITLLLLFVFAGGVAFGQRKGKSDPCANPLTQSEMNQCAGKAYREADARLNEAYRKLVSMLDEAEIAQLKEAQTAWLKYRDTNCMFVADQYKGGSIHPLIQSTCLKEVTNRRTVELKAQIKERNL
jgi:uncharacterized protein YecT (DUF1311 family)